MNINRTYKEIFEDDKVIAVVGFSENNLRPSNRIARYLKSNGYIVYGVNPFIEKSDADGIKCIMSVAELPEPPDIINVFRRSEFVSELMNEIINLRQKPKVIWTQYGVISMEAAAISLQYGIQYVENKCIMVEHNNLL